MAHLLAWVVYLARIAEAVREAVFRGYPAGSVSYYAVASGDSQLRYQRKMSVEPAVKIGLRAAQASFVDLEESLCVGFVLMGFAGHHDRRLRVSLSCCIGWQRKGVRC